MRLGPNIFLGVSGRGGLTTLPDVICGLFAYSSFELVFAEVRDGKTDDNVASHSLPVSLAQWLFAFFP